MRFGGGRITSVVLHPSTFCCCLYKIELSLAELGHGQDGKRIINFLSVLSFGSFAIDTSS